MMKNIQVFLLSIIVILFSLKNVFAYGADFTFMGMSMPFLRTAAGVFAGCNIFLMAMDLGRKIEKSGTEDESDVEQQL